MKHFVLYLTFFAVYLFQLTTAYGPRGAAERVLYYYAYLAEEIDPTKNKDTYTIAKNCGSEMAGVRPLGRCNFAQLLEYLWAPNDPKNTNEKRPHLSDPRNPVVRLDPKQDILDLPLKTVWQSVLGWRDRDNLGGRITGNIDSSRLVENPKNWYNALGKVGDPIGKAQANMVDSPSNRKLVAAGQDAATLLHDLRYSDMEAWRIAAVWETLRDHNIELILEAGRVTQAPNERPWAKIDAAETISKNIVDHPDVAAKLESAITSWQEGGEDARGHWSAMLSARKAMVGSGCTRSVMLG